MATIKTKFSVGIFVIAGFSIAAAALIWYGLSGYLNEGRLFAAYFDESVQGLDKDSSVKYRGVKVGKVESIDVSPDDTLIRVVLKIEKDMQLTPDIVAQLKSVGITGIMFVELDTRQDGEPDFSPKISFKSEYPVVGTKPSDLKKYMKSIDNLLRQAGALDIRGISDRTKLTLDNVNKLLKSIDTAGSSMDTLIANVNGTISSINRTFVHLDDLVQNNEADLSSTVTGLSHSVDKAGRLLGEGADFVNQAELNLEILQKSLMSTLQNLEQSSRKLNLAADKIADQPSLLLFSKPLPERENLNTK